MNSKTINNSTKIALFSSIRKGGMVQFAFEMYKQLKTLGYNVYCIMPENIEHDDIDISNANIMFYRQNLLYNKFTRLYSDLTIMNKDVKNVAQLILQYGFSLIISTDTSSFSLKTIHYISQHSPKILSAITVHDAVSHPSNKKTFKSLYYFFTAELFRKECLMSPSFLIFLSESTRKKFISAYPDINKKQIILPLGAHIPNVLPEKPIEINPTENDYLLFFGRIDKYKGLGRFLKAYNSIETNKRKFIIAGNGLLTEEENDLINQCKDIILIHRFISNQEMIWLFQNARALVLPYIEASQSGVIPIAYHFKCPVICSNIEGLAQFVENGQTGILCNDGDDFKKAICAIDNEASYSFMKNGAYEYSCTNFDWKKNIIKALKDINLLLNNN